VKTTMQANRRGLGTILFLLVLAALLAGLLYGYGIFCEKYYVALYDAEMVRYIDVPPYARRLDPAVNDLKGQCLLEIGTSQDQVNTFFGAMAKRRGFIFRAKDAEGEIEFEVTPHYLVKGTYKGNQLALRWNPVLSEALRQKYEKVFPGEPLPVATPTKALKR
jgi:hypothetical protein